MSMRKIADKLKNEEQKLQMTSEDVDDDDDLEGKLLVWKFRRCFMFGNESASHLGDNNLWSG